MAEAKPEDSNIQAVPFFARFLEGQSFEEISDEESESLNGGHKFKNKYKDKGDDDDIVVTLKFPSDQEDGVTKKAPSDTDEHAIFQQHPHYGDDCVFPIK
jgi:hypothetical protein